MAKKKKSKKGGKRKGGGSKAGIFDTDKLIGFAAAKFANSKLVPKVAAFTKLDPKIQAAAKIFAGGWLPKQSFVSSVGSPGMRQAVGDGLIYEGVSELMTSFGVAGLKSTRKVHGNHYLGVSVEGLEDAEKVSEDVIQHDEHMSVLADDYEIGADDLSTVNDDINGEDISTVNDDMGDDFQM